MLVAPILWPSRLVLVAPILWPSGLVPSLPMRLCLLGPFPGPLGWRPLFLSVCASCGWRCVFLSVCTCCAYSLALGLAPSLPFCLCLLRLFSGPLGWRPLFLCLPMCLCLLCIFPGPLGWRPLFLSVCACWVFFLALWAVALSSYPFVLVAPIPWPSGLSPSLPIRLCLLRLFSGPLGWRLLFLSVRACWAYSLTLCACALSSYPFVLVAPILWPSGLAPCLPMCLCLLCIFSGPLGWRPLFLSVCACCAYSLALWVGALSSSVFQCVYACCAYSLALWVGALSSYPFVLVGSFSWPSGLSPSLPIRLCLLRLFSGPLGWRPVFQCVYACCAYSLALWVGALSSYPFVLAAPILWPAGLAPCLPICLCSLRRILGSSWLAFFLSFLFFVVFASIIGPLGWRPLFLFVRACCAYSRARCAITVPLVLYWICAFLALWAGALSSYSFMLVSPVLWLSGLAFVLYWFCVSLTLWAGGLSSYPFMLVAPILSPSWLLPHFPP